MTPKPITDIVQKKVELLQTESDSGNEFAASEISQQIQNSRGNGKSLPSDTNLFMSNAFGNDFSGVHKGSPEEGIRQ